MSAKIKQSLREQLLKDKQFLKALRGLCPDGKGCTSIEISSGDQSVTLTPETRKKINASLRKLEDKP